MDANTQITLTIWGMIAAFITAALTAFLAEPVKTFFQNRGELKNLKTSLYKELLNNYNVLGLFLDDAEDLKPYASILEKGIRTECYKHALENALTLFYQLGETNEIHVMQMRLSEITQVLDKNDTDSQKLKMIPYWCRSYIAAFAKYSYMEKLDNKLLRKLMETKRYEQLIKLGKEETRQPSND